MLVGIQKALAWATAFAAVFAFYAHSVFGLPSYQVTPVLAVVIATGLVGMAYFGFLQLRHNPAGSPARQASSVLLTVTLLLAFASTAAHAFADDLPTAEWGVAGVTFGVPVLVGFSNVRADLLKAIGTMCVAFAVVDLAFDMLDYLGIAHLANHVGSPGSPYGLHYLGATGSSYATGLVGFLAISFIASGLTSGCLIGNIARMAAIAALIGSVYLTGARTYLAASLASTAIFVATGNRRAPLIVFGTTIAGLFLYMTFNHASGDQDNALRSMLILDGFQGALEHPILGSGPHYIDTSSLIATYQELHSAGIVESGIAQFAIFYGLPAALSLVVASLTAQGARRPGQSFASIILCLMTAVFAFSSPLTSFLGSIAFYTALVYCQRDELGARAKREAAGS